MNFQECIESYDYNYLCSCSFKKSFKKIKKMILKLFIKKNDKVTPEKEILLENDIENQNQNIIIVNDDDLYRMYNNTQEELTEQLEKYIEESEQMDQIITDSDEEEWITVNISD